MTQAEKIADTMRLSGAYTICCPANVAQVARESCWCGMLSDKSLLFCDYEKRETHCGMVEDGVDNWTAIYAFLDKHHKTREIQL